ncbi:hypothetical protein J7K25_06965, partial [bacterium]|nr:hypothetical protein [bacterium]
MRKLLIGVIGILFLGFIGFSYADPTVSIPDTTVAAGTATVEIPINIDNGTGIAGFQFTVTFDQNVLNATGATAGSLTSGWTITSNPTVEGEITIAGFDPSLNGISGGSGSLCILQFNVVGNPGQSTDLIFTVSKLRDNQSNPIPFSSLNGTFTILQRETYNLTINIQPDECTATTTPSAGTHTYDENTVVNVTANENDDWLFDHWEGDVADPNSANTTVTMDDDKTVTAVFVRNAPELSVNPTSVEFSFNIGNPGEVTTKDTQITIENTGASGILEWEVGEINYQEGEGWIQVFVPTNGIGGELNPGEQKIIGIQGDRTGLSAGIYHATVPIESNAGTENINITMRIIDESGERHISIPDSSGCSGSTVEIPINIDDGTGIAGFQFTVTFDNNVLNATGAIAGSLTSGWTITSNTNTPGQISIAGLDSSLNGISGGSGSLCIMQFNVVGNPGQATGLTFTFSKLADVDGQQIAHTFTNGSFLATGYTLTTSISPAGSGTVTKNPDKTEYEEGEEVQLTATPNQGYRFKNWSGDVPAGHENDNPISITMNSDKNIVAHFVKQYTLTMGVNPAGGGTTNPAVGDHLYDENTVVNISATANPGYRFDHWEGDVADPNSVNTTVTMDEDKTVTAHFVKTYNLTINIQPGECTATTTPSAGTHTYDEGEVVNVVAIENADWLFDHWEGDATGTEKSIEITMDSDKNITAVFKKVGFTIEPDKDNLKLILESGTEVDTQIQVFVNKIGNFSNNVNLTAEVSSDTGIKVNLSPENGTPPFTSQLNLTLSGCTKPDTYILTITGQSGDIIHSEDVTIVANTLVYIPTVYASTQNDTPVEIPVITSNSKGLSGFQFIITFNPEFLDATEVETSVVPGDLTSGWSIMPNTITPGQISIGGFDLSLSELDCGKGSIAIVKLKVIGDIPEEGIPLNIKEVILSDAEVNPLPVVAENGLLLPGIKGDLNKDGEVNIFDVILCLRQALELDEPTLQADMNDDGEVN